MQSAIGTGYDILGRDVLGFDLKPIRVDFIGVGDLPLLYVSGKHKEFPSLGLGLSLGEGRGGFRILRIYWRFWRVVSARSMLVSVLIMLVGALVCPRSHYRNICTYLFRCSVEALASRR